MAIRETYRKMRDTARRFQRGPWGFWGRLLARGILGFQEDSLRRVLTVCVLAMVACSNRPPRRPEGLPASAVWIGKGDQGRFVDIGARNGMFWTIQVIESKGQRNPVTRWRLQGFARTSLEPQEIVGFVDGAILLNDGSTLIPAP